MVLVLPKHTRSHLLESELRNNFSLDCTIKHFSFGCRLNYLLPPLKSIGLISLMNYLSHRYYCDLNIAPWASPPQQFIEQINNPPCLEYRIVILKSFWLECGPSQGRGSFFQTVFNLTLTFSLLDLLTHTYCIVFL